MADRAGGGVEGVFKPQDERQSGVVEALFDGDERGSRDAKADGEISLAQLELLRRIATMAPMRRNAQQLGASASRRRFCVRGLMRPRQSS